jgi:hypothetical protein
MANRKQHAVLGAAAGVAGYALYSLAREETMSWPESIGFALSGIIGDFLPQRKLCRGGHPSNVVIGVAHQG